MANLFDQFDETTPTDAMPPAAASDGANPFDRFDGSSPAAPSGQNVATLNLPGDPLDGTPFAIDPDQSGVSAGMVRGILPDGRKNVIGARLLKRGAPEPSAGIAANAAAGGNRVLAGMLGAPMDLAQGAVNLGARAVNAVAGTALPTDVESPAGSAAIRRGMETVGIHTDSVAPQTAGERIAAGVGEAVMGGAAGGGIAGMARGAAATSAGPISRALAPVVEAMIPRTGGQFVGNAAMDAVAGGTGKVAEEMAPEPYKPIAGLAGNLLGGGLAATVGAGLPAALRSGARHAADYVAPITPAGQQRMAARIIDGEASDSRALRESLAGNGADIVPGSAPTTFQRTGDMGLGALERRVERENPEPFQVRRADQNAARRAALDAVQPRGAAETVSAFLRDRLGQIESDGQSQVRDAIGKAQAAADAAGGHLTPEQYGETLRTALQSSNDAAKAKERALWAAVDPEGALSLPVPATQGAVKEIVQEQPRMSGGFTPPESAILDDFAYFGGARGDAMPFGELTAMRSRVSEEMRAARGPNGSPSAYRRLSILRSAIEDDIDRAVENIATRQDELVASGQMSEKDTLLARMEAAFAAERGGWYAERAQRVGENDGTGAGAAGSVRSTSIPSASRAKSAGRSRPERAAGAPGIPGDDQFHPNFDEAAVSRLKAASAETRRNAEVYKRSPVAEALRRPMADGPYVMPDSAVGDRFFVSGPTGAERVQQFRKAAGDDAALATLGDYAASDLRRSALTGDGSFDPAKVDAWRRRHGDALRAFPALDRKLADAKAASEAARQAAERASDRLAGEQRGALGQIIGRDGVPVESPEDVVKLIGGIFARKDAATEVKRIADRVASSEPAREGLKKAVAEHIASRLVSNTEVGASGLAGMKSDTFQTFVKRNTEALRAAGFSDEQVKVLNAIADDLQRANRSIAALRIPGGSDTYQNLAAGIRAAGPASKQSIASYVIGATVTGTTGLGALAGAIGAGAVNAMRAAGLRNVNDLVVDALLNPGRARALLAKVTPAEARSPATQRTLGDIYRRAAIGPAAASAIASSAGQPEPQGDELLRRGYGRMAEIIDAMSRPRGVGEEKAVRLPPRVRDAWAEYHDRGGSLDLASILVRPENAEAFRDLLRLSPNSVQARNLVTAIFDRSSDPEGAARAEQLAVWWQGMRLADRRRVMDVAGVKWSERLDWTALSPAIRRKLGARYDLSFDSAAHEAATSPTNDLPDPTDAEREAGNFKMGHVKVGGLDISVEIPAGGTRRGTDAAGKPWERELAHHYGYIKRTTGADGENVDVYLGPMADDVETPVYVVNQLKQNTTTFDEHKVMIGFPSAGAARQAYTSNFPSKVKTFGGMKRMTHDEFKEWLRIGDARKPVPTNPQ